MMTVAQPRVRSHVFCMKCLAGTEASEANRQIPSFLTCAYGTAEDQNELWVDNYTVHTELKHRTGCCEQTIL